MSSAIAKTRALLLRLARSVRGRDGGSDFDEELELHVAMTRTRVLRPGWMKLGRAEQARQAQRDRARLVPARRAASIEPMQALRTE